jgi:hypothetical protein
LLAFLIGLTIGLGAASRAGAQGMVSNPASTSYSSFYWVPAHYDAGALGKTYVAPYNYYLAPYGLPARQYVGFGTNDFPFYGQPYGNPSGPWSWPFLGTYPDPRLIRYYYPPVP